MALLWMKKDGAHRLPRGEAGLSLVGEPVDPLDLKPEPRADLLATIEEQIIPRLVLAHIAEGLAPAPCPDARPPPTKDEVEAFAQIAACQDLPSTLAYIETMCRDGLTLESVLLDLVTPAARLLGAQWQDDLRGFNEVTTGLGTLQQAVQVLGPSFAPALAHRGLVVLVAAPREQHTLGIYLVGEFLRRAGWGVQLDPSMSEPEIAELVATERVEMVGISVSNPELLGALSAFIATIRKASCNPKMGIVLGGSVQLADYAKENGCAVCSGDPRDAVLWLEHHVKSSRS
jgi:methanogenic corrinoid protein MtbC1